MTCSKFFEISATNLTRKDVLFKWTLEHQKGFEELKRILSTEPLLIYPDFSQPFLLRVTRRLNPLELSCHNCEMDKKGLLLTVVDS